ncbi:MAG: hypothetical protein ACFE85_08000 [Candidatus Hodarchaeota archaeon]
MQDFFFWFLLIFFTFFLILYFYLKCADEDSKLNNFFGFGAIFIVFIHILIFLLLIFQDLSLISNLLQLWIFSLCLPIILIGMIIIISTVIAYFCKYYFKEKNFSSFGNKMRIKLSERSKLRNDIYRKIPHILIFIGLFVLWYIGVYFVKNVTGSTEGMIPFENNMLYLYFQILTEPNSVIEVLFSLGWFYYLLFFFFYSFSLCMLANEYTRKSKRIFFPFNIFCTILLCDEEKSGYGTYLYFAISHLFTAFLCPPMVLFTILGISSIADLMTSQVGIRFGKNHIKWNEDKTWEGTLAGIIGCFVISLFFTGLIWAFIFSIVFLLFDILTRKPINMSDNLLVPIGLAIIFVIIRFYFNLDYYTIILTWI